MSHRKSYKTRWMQIARSSKKNENADDHQMRLLFERSLQDTASTGACSDSAKNETPVSAEIINECHVAENVTQFDSIADTSDNEDTHFWQAIDDDVRWMYDSPDSTDDECLSQETNTVDTVTATRAVLAEWAVEENVSLKTVECLLTKLRTNVKCLASLPCTARTLLNTPSEIPIKKVSGMDYYHFGLKDQLTLMLSSTDIDSLEQLDLIINIDGIPLFRSSKTSAWPILCCVSNFSDKVFPVTVTCGPSKPHNLDFLNETVTELQDLVANGLPINNRVLKVSLKCIVCDAPAKAFVKCTKLCSGYYGCDKCTQKGQWSKDGRKVIFPDIHSELRSDESFRNATQKEHHHGISPFALLNIDMVDTFAVDYMHQVCLGVVRRVLLLWIRGPKTVKISSLNVQVISERLIAMRACIPSLFPRKPRSLSDIDLWKATEFRQFLLYTGPIVLKGVLRDDLYNHFLYLSVAISILVSPALANNHSKFAHELLVDFVENAKSLYGEPFLVYNVHSLLHLADQVNNFKSLDACAAWPFENHLQKLKKMVRSGKSPVVQIVKRLSEANAHNMSFRDAAKHEILSCKAPDNAYRLDDGSYAEIISCTKSESHEDQYLCRVYYRLAEPVYTHPWSSTLIGHGKVRETMYSVKVLSHNTLVTAARCIPICRDSHIIFLCLLHDRTYA